MNKLTQTLIGKKGDTFRAKLFHEVVELNQQRIYGRIQSSHATVSYRKKGRQTLPLHSVIVKQLAKIWTPDFRCREDVIALRSDLISLRDSLKRIEKGSSSDQIYLLKDAIMKSHCVSNQGASKSLETRLQRIGYDIAICDSPQVKKIDKLSRYWQCCIDFIHFSRNPKTRPLCKNLSLEVCVAPETGIPPGAGERCYVHGEVQLALFYEQHRPDLPPRALGSSKSACFLCDLFIAHHGKFRMSHSHMKLYSKWMIPQCEWTTEEQKQIFREVVAAMTSDIKSCRQRAIYYSNIATESLAHLPRFERLEDLAPSDVSTSLHHMQEVVSPCIVVQSGSESSTSTARLIPISESPPGIDTHHAFFQLPIKLPIFRQTRSCTITINRVEYFFDLEDVDAGRLYLSETEAVESHEGRTMVHVADCKVDSTICLKADQNPRSLVFYLMDTLGKSLRIDLVWNSATGV